MKKALEQIRAMAVDHPRCDRHIFETRDVAALNEIGGDIFDWTMIAILADDALKSNDPANPI